VEFLKDEFRTPGKSGITFHGFLLQQAKCFFDVSFFGLQTMRGKPSSGVRGFAFWWRLFATRDIASTTETAATDRGGCEINSSCIE
jgi:hypothetical protein